MANGDPISGISGAFNTLTKKKGLAAGVGGASAASVLAAFVLFGQVYGDDLKKGDTALLEVTTIKQQVINLDSNFKDAMERLEGNDEKQEAKLDRIGSNLLLFLRQQGIEPVEQPSEPDEPKEVERVTIFVPPSPALPLGNVLERQDTLFIPTTDTNLLRLSVPDRDTI